MVLQVHTPSSTFLVLLTMVTLCSFGCADYGWGAIHKVSFRQPAVVGADEAHRDDALKQLVRNELVARGFEEKPGTPHIWRRRGVSVQVYRDQESQLMLRVRAFGSKRDVRLAQETEEELLAALKERSGIELIPVIASDRDDRTNR